MATFDTESLRLALELQLRDVEGLQTTAGGRKRKREANDFDAALTVYQEHLTAEIGLVGGRVPAAAAEASSFRPRKRVATRKRKLAAPRTRVPRLRKTKASTAQTTAQTTASAQAANAEAEQKTNVPARTSAEVLRCSVCMEVLTKNLNFRAPCNHLYCASCLIRHVTASIADQVDGGLKFPPECCSVPLPIIGAALALLPADLRTRLGEKQLERSTPNPRYCHNAACGKFIPPSNFTDDYGTCAACGRQTCILCKAARHNGICPDDPAQNAVRGMARLKGWQACTRCGRYVEKVMGCMHISCLCGRRFCYRCGRDWGQHASGCRG